MEFGDREEDWEEAANGINVEERSVHPLLIKQFIHEQFPTDTAFWPHTPICGQTNQEKSMESPGLNFYQRVFGLPDFCVE